LDDIDVTNACPQQYPNWLNFDLPDYNSRNMTDCSPLLWDFDELTVPGTDDEVEPYTENGAITC